MGEEETPLRRFLVDCLCGRSSGTGFLHFEVAGITPIQNLIENLLIILLQESPHKRKLNQLTMTLLFMQLMGHTETLNTPDAEQAVILKVLAYIKNRYVDGSLTELAEQLHYDLYSLSREIKRKTGKNYTQLVQENRLAQAAFLLKNTDRNVDDIANAVGYENMGYFHRIFKDTYGVSPPSLQTANQVTFLAKTRPPFLILAMVEWLKNKKGGLSLRYFLAIDIGASSGRHIVGWQENGEIKTNEVYRFPIVLRKKTVI